MAPARSLAERALTPAPPKPSDKEEAAEVQSDDDGPGRREKRRVRRVAAHRREREAGLGARRETAERPSKRRHTRTGHLPPHPQPGATAPAAEEPLPRLHAAGHEAGSITAGVMRNLRRKYVFYADGDPVMPWKEPAAAHKEEPGTTRPHAGPAERPARQAQHPRAPNRHGRRRAAPQPG
mgnify:CR=1 FL=1